jgi:ribosome maturation factor RimP
VGELAPHFLFWALECRSPACSAPAAAFPCLLWGVLVEPHELERQMTERLAALGFELVELRRGGSSRHPHLSVRIDWTDIVPGRKVTVDDCALVSRALEAWLDEAGIGGGQYILEVSSPGMDRPLRRLEDWRRFTGRAADVLVPQHGGRFRVTITSVVDEPEPAVELQFPKGDRRIVRLSEIKEARLGIEL